MSSPCAQSATARSQALRFTCCAKIKRNSTVPTDLRVRECQKLSADVTADGFCSSFRDWFYPNNSCTDGYL